MTVEEPHTTPVCPQCGANLTSDPRFVVWCPACDWNVDPEPEPELGRIDRRLARASATASRRMYEDIASSGVYRDRGRTAALRMVALLAHALTVVVLILAVVLISGVLGTSGPVAIAFGLVALGAGLYVQPFRPHWHKQPARRWLTRTEAPQLFALVDEVAAVIGARGLDDVSISSNFNAWIVRDHGRWRMNLGLALWSVLSPAERAGLIAHELGHQVNGDQRREWLVRTATVTMYRWAYLLNPRASRYRRQSVTPGEGLASIGEVLAMIAMAPVAIAAAGLAHALAVLSARQGMSAEYYADMLEARVAGTEAAANGLEKLLLADACWLLVQRVGRYEAERDPWKEVASYIASVPADALERQRRVARRRLPAVDMTHPPTQLRADLLRRLPHEEGRVQVDAARMAAIDAELASVVTRVTTTFRANLRG